MNDYAKYLARKLKDEFDSKVVVIKNMLVDKQGHILWDVDNASHCKKCCIVGVQQTDRLAYFISRTSKTYGDAIHFSNNWVHSGSIRCNVDDYLLHDSNAFGSIFMQMMAMSEKHSIWLGGKKLFEKGHAYQYLMEAELTSY